MRRFEREGSVRLLGVALAAAWLGAVALWLAAALDRPAPPALSRVVVASAVLLTLTWIGAWIGRAISRARGQRSLAPLVPVLLLALALAVRLVGLDHEVTEGFYLDEGTYSQHAAQINDEPPQFQCFRCTNCWICCTKDGQGYKYVLVSGRH
jgi:hypothetical protein